MMEVMADRGLIANSDEDKNEDMDDSNGSEESGYEDEEVFVKVVSKDPRPIPLYKQELIEAMAKKRKKREVLYYEDVGEDIHIKVSRKPNENFGLTLICGEVFTPSWPAIIDIKKDSPASEVNLKIGDQIKELRGIDTNTLTHWQLIALFTNATDEITMTVRRGLDRSHTTFDWYKHPFSTVRQDFEELVITDIKDKSPVHKGRCLCHSCSDAPRGRVTLKSFKLEDDLNNINVNHVSCHRRSLSASSATKSTCVKNGIERRRRITNHTGPQNFRHNGQHISPADEGRFIAHEIERIYAQKNHLETVRNSLCDSSNSVSSTLSDSTASSFSSSSSTTHSDQANGNHGNWMEHVMSSSDTCIFNDDVFEKTFDKSAESGRTVTKSPGSKFRESFRRKKTKKETTVRENSEEVKYTLKCKDSTDNTLILTVWIIDRRKLGLTLGGGSVSAYGDSNVKIIDIKKTGTAYKVFRVGDELLEIGGTTTNGLNVYDVNRIISNLEGQYVEFKLFRPKCN